MKRFALLISVLTSFSLWAEGNKSEYIFPYVGDQATCESLAPKVQTTFRRHLGLEAPALEVSCVEHAGEGADFGIVFQITHEPQPGFQFSLTPYRHEFSFNWLIPRATSEPQTERRYYLKDSRIDFQEVVSSTYVNELRVHSYSGDTLEGCKAFRRASKEYRPASSEKFLAVYCQRVEKDRFVTYVFSRTYPFEDPKADQ